MRRWRLLGVAAGVWVTAAAMPGQVLSAEQALGAEQAITEEQALERMRIEHPYLQALRLGVRELEADARERSLLTNPTVSYTREDAGLGVDDFLLVSQELPVRGRPGLLGEAAGQAAMAARARADAARLAFETDLRLAFTTLLLAQERLAVIDAAVTELRRLVDVLRAREREGEGSRFDRLRAEREVADIEADLEAAAIDRLAAQARLASFFAPGTDASGLAAVGALLEDRVPAGPDALLARAIDRRPDYRALTLSAAQWTTERRAAERLRYPGAAVNAGLKRSGAPMGRESGYAVTATLAVPLFNRGQAQVARAEAARARTDAERRVLGGRIETEVRAAHAAAARYRTLADRYRVESVEPAGELASIAAVAYEEGEYGILELLDAHRVTLGAGLRLLEFSAAARRAGIRLDQAAGGRMMP